MADADFYNVNLRRAYPLVDPGDDSLHAIRQRIVDVGFMFLPAANVDAGTPVFLTECAWDDARRMWKFHFEVDGYDALSIRFLIPPTEERFATYWTSVRYHGTERADYGSAFVVIGDGLPDLGTDISSSSWAGPCTFSAIAAAVVGGVGATEIDVTFDSDLDDPDNFQLAGWELDCDIDSGWEPAGGFTKIANNIIRVECNVLPTAVNAIRYIRGANPYVFNVSGCVLSNYLYDETP